MAKNTYSTKGANDGAPKASRKKKKKKSIIKRLLLILLVVVLLVTSVFAGTFMGFVDNSMDIIAEEYNLNFTSIVYYIDKSTNQPVEYDRIHSTENRIWVDIANVPENLSNAFIAIEDERFRDHRGMDIKRTFGAFIQWVMGNDSYGGSTITQQLVKNVTGDRDRSPLRKVTEIFRAMNLERKMSKDQIIEMYMNTIYFGSGCHGIQVAANHYFGKDVSELSVEECASLAAIVKAPTTYNPATNYENNKERRDVVLNKMAELEFITQEECDAAKAKETKVRSGATEAAQKNQDVKSYFVDAVIDDVIAGLMEKENISESEATTMLYTGGYKIYSTVDPKVQEAIDSVYKNTSNFPNSSIQSAMVVMDPYTGHIKGMAGGIGEKTIPRGLNRATQSKRQPGSSFKPVAVYAPAIEHNVITPATLINDAPLAIGDWKPKNSGGKFLGKMTARTAIERSQNIPAVKIMRELSPEKSFDFLTKKLGFTTLVEEKEVDGEIIGDQNLSTALGGVTYGVTVEEMTAAYSTFANSGMYNKPVTYTKVIDANGKVILENKVQNKKAMSEETAYIMTNMLTGVTTSSIGTGRSAKLSGIMTAGKTGTTNSNKDRWFMGFTPNYVGGVWMGYDQPKSMSGSNFCPGIWKKVMTQIHEGEEIKTIPVPDDVVKRTICQNSGKVASASCSNTRIDYFKEGTQPMKYCSSHEAPVVIDPNAEPTPTPEVSNPNAGESEGVIDGDANDTSSNAGSNDEATPGVNASEADDESTWYGE